MLKEPKISVISPCFNHGKYVREMLESVFAQTFDDYEIIIVNDGSTDDTAQILDKIMHEKVKVIHTENLGPASARNIAIENAHAPIILNLDADDKIAATLLEKAFKIFSHNPNIGIVHSNVEFFGSRSGDFKIGDYSIENMLYDNCIHSTACFLKSDWELVGGYSDELIFALEDYDFWLSIIELGREVYKIHESLVYYRTYKNPIECRSGRMKIDRQKQMESVITIFKRHRNLYSTNLEGWEHFSKMEKKWKNENIVLSQIKDLYHNIKNWKNYK